MTLPVLPPLQGQYFIFEVDTASMGLTPAPITPNPGSDRELQNDACKMLGETTGKKYIVLETTQEWGFATFDYIVDVMPKETKQ